MTTADPYFQWLCAKVGTKGERMKPLLVILEALHSREFAPILLPMDQNRALDGLHLRAEFTNEHGEQGSSASRGRCTVLEMMIGLAGRMCFLMESTENPRRIEEFFWKMVENLGISSVTALGYPENFVKRVTNKAVDHLLNRDYLPNGSGSLFPLTHPRQDMRQVEIWYQMHAWLSENYRSEFL